MSQKNHYVSKRYHLTLLVPIAYNSTVGYARLFHFLNGGRMCNDAHPDAYADFLTFEIWRACYRRGREECRLIRATVGIETIRQAFTPGYIPASLLKVGDVRMKQTSGRTTILDDIKIFLAE